jgi:hypothetical protein
MRIVKAELKGLHDDDTAPAPAQPVTVQPVTVQPVTQPVVVEPIAPLTPIPGDTPTR